MTKAVVLLGTLLALSTAALAEPLTEVGSDAFQVTLEGLQASSKALQIKLEIDNLTRVRRIFLHHEANQKDAHNFFFIPRATPNLRTHSTLVLPISPQGTLSVDITYKLDPGEHPGLLVLGSDQAPYQQVAVALAPLLTDHWREAAAMGQSAEIAPHVVTAEPAESSRKNPRDLRGPARRLALPEKNAGPALPEAKNAAFSAGTVQGGVREARSQGSGGHAEGRARSLAATAGKAGGEDLMAKGISSPGVRLHGEGNQEIAVRQRKDRPPIRATKAPLRQRKPLRLAGKAPEKLRRGRSSGAGAQVVFLPPNFGDRALEAFRPPDPRFGREVVLWQGRAGAGGYGWSLIHQQHPDVDMRQIAYAATYPHQVWTDGKTYLFVRWDDQRGGALVLQIARNAIVSAQWATYDDLLYWLGPGKIYPHLVYESK